MTKFRFFSILSVIVLFLTLIFTYPNFNSKLPNWWRYVFPANKINLGLDLQGGSYLLLEINSDSLVKEKIQSKVIPIKKLLKENNLNFSKFKIGEKKLSLEIEDLEKFELIFFSKKNNLVNPFIDKYRSLYYSVGYNIHEMERLTDIINSSIDSGCADNVKVKTHSHNINVENVMKSN